MAMRMSITSSLGILRIERTFSGGGGGGELLPLYGLLDVSVGPDLFSPLRVFVYENNGSKWDSNVIRCLGVCVHVCICLFDNCGTTTFEKDGHRVSPFCVNYLVRTRFGRGARKLISTFTSIISHQVCVRYADCIISSLPSQMWTSSLIWRDRKNNLLTSPLQYISINIYSYIKSTLTFYFFIRLTYSSRI